MRESKMVLYFTLTEANVVFTIIFQFYAFADESHN
jgi:hypothetical protein